MTASSLSASNPSGWWLSRCEGSAKDKALSTEFLFMCLWQLQSAILVQGFGREQADDTRTDATEGLIMRGWLDGDASEGAVATGRCRWSSTSCGTGPVACSLPCCRFDDVSISSKEETLIVTYRMPPPQGVPPTSLAPGPRPRLANASQSKQWFSPRVRISSA